MRILVVEDTEDLADAIVHRLRKLGYAVDWAPTGDEAEELLRQETYQLVLLDIMLPGVDGQTLLNRLRQRRDVTPVLVMTARSQVNVRIDLLDLGADDFIVKPFDLRELEARCRAARTVSPPPGRSSAIWSSIPPPRRCWSMDGPSIWGAASSGFWSCSSAT